MKTVDIEISQDLLRECSFITMPDYPSYYEVWELAIKLQKIDFKIKRVIKEGAVQEYSEDIEQRDMGRIDTVILEFQYNEINYFCEIGVEKFIIRPIFPAEDYLKKRLFECIVDPASVYLQTSTENIESAEMNLSLGSIRSASSDIYYAVHNLLKSIQFTHNRDETILISDTHPPLFLANLQQGNETTSEYVEKLKQSFNSQLGRINTWSNIITPSLNKFETDFQEKQLTLDEFKRSLNQLVQDVLNDCEKRAEFENSDYNIHKYLLEVQSLLSQKEEVTEIGKDLSILIIATYEARVLGDYKYNFESMLSRSYITLLFWFAEEFVKIIKLKSVPARLIQQQESIKVSELHIVTNKMSRNAIIGIVKVTNSSFDTIAFKDKFFDEYGNSISIIGWEKEFPIKFRILKLSQAPITIEIHESNQIDIYVPYDSDKTVLHQQFEVIENLIQKTYEFIVEDYPNAQVKISPVTLSFQHQLVKEVERRQSNIIFSRRHRDLNLRKIISKIEGYETTGENYRETTMVIGGEKHNFITLDINPHGSITRFISDAIGNAFLSRRRLSSEKTIIFSNENTYNQLIEKDLLQIFEVEAKSQLVYFKDDIWEKLLYEQLEDEEATKLKYVLLEKIESNVLPEVAAEIE